jgi:hypothetical protein
MKMFTIAEIEGMIEAQSASVEDLNQRFSDHFERKPITDESGNKRQLSADEVTLLEDTLQRAVKTLNDYEAQLKYKHLIACEDPLMAALRNPTFEVTALKKCTPDKTSVRHYYEIVRKERTIDLLTLNKEGKKAGIKIGVDEDWPAMLDNLNYTMYAHVAYRLNAGVIPRTDFKMSKLADKVDMISKGGFNMALPISKRSVDHDLNACVHALVGGEFTATKHDYEAILLGYLTKDKKKLLNFKSRKSGSDFDFLFLAMMHRIVTNGKYTVECKQRS